jgi:hypothetical protein
LVTRSAASSAASPGPHPADRRQEPRGHRGERLADAPHAILALGVDVAEHAQDALAAVGPRRKGVDVQPRVVLARRQRASRRGGRTEARARALDVRRVVGQQPLDQPGRGRGEAGDHRVQRALVVAARVASADALAVEPDVLARAVEPARVEEALLARRDREHAVGQHEQAAVLERSRGARALAIGPRRRERAAVPGFDRDVHRGRQ